MLHVRTFGSGSPVLALHGLNGHGGRFADLAARLGTVRLAAPDLRGHGLSELLPPWTLDRHVADVAETLEGVLDPLDVVGYSFGGAVAVALASARPDLVKRLVLLDPSIGLAPEFVAPKANLVMRDESYVDRAEAAAASPFPEDAAGPLLVQGDDNRWRWRISAPAIVTAFSEACRLLAAPSVPTLLVRTAGNPEGSRAYAAVCAGAANVRIETLDCGHRLLQERPAEVAALVRDFLAL